jgi:hypothetical protein
MVSFTGSPPRIRELQGLLQHNELQVALTFTVPAEHLNDSRYTESIVVESSDLHLPPGISATMVEGRNRVSLTLHRLIERRLPVQFESVGEEPLGPLVIEPATVLVRGPRDVLERALTISTQPSELPVRSSRTRTAMRVPLVQDLEGRPVRVTPNRVSVRSLAPPRKIYDLQEVPVHFLCPTDFPMRPTFVDERAGKIRLRVRGLVRDEPPKVHAFVDLTRGPFPAGRYNEPVQVQLPKDFELAQDPPQGASFQLVPEEVAPKDAIPAP